MKPYPLVLAGGLALGVMGDALAAPIALSPVTTEELVSRVYTRGDCAWVDFFLTTTTITYRERVPSLPVGDGGWSGSLGTDDDDASLPPVHYLAEPSPCTTKSADLWTENEKHQCEDLSYGVGGSNLGSAGDTPDAWREWTTTDVKPRWVTVNHCTPTDCDEHPHDVVTPELGTLTLLASGAGLMAFARWLKEVLL